MAVKQKLPRGVTEIRDGKHEAKPFRVEHRGKRSYYETAEQAISEKSRLKSLESSHGTESIQYSRQAHGEYETSMRLLRAASLEANLPDVVRFYINHHRVAVGAPTSVKMALNAFLERKGDLNRSPRHVSDLKSRLKQFTTQFGERELNSIQRNEIEAWLLALNLSARTVKNHFICLSNFH